MSEESPTRQRKLRGSSDSSSIASGKEINNGDIIVDINSEEEDKNGKAAAKKVSSAYTLLSVTIIAAVTVLFVKYMDARLPTPLTIADIPENPSSFIEERAREDLHTLVSVGVRVTGSTATDVDTVNNFINIMDGIKSSCSPLYTLEYEAQRPSGAFWDKDDEGFTSSYSKVANVVAKLEAADAEPRRDAGILLNCHFDSKPASPGATDNMISCSVMLEILRVLCSQNELLVRNSIVFLFNGAEELGLQGAHGFIQGRSEDSPTMPGHQWSNNLKAFINLEGAGAGGREILFQATGGYTEQTGWLIKAYKESPYPYGNVIAEEAFQNGLIPSDTDFRIFRDYGNIPGLDIAFIKNGWVYHTKWDRLTEIPPGSIQHMGTNALAMTKYLGNLDFSKDHESAGEMVFFDVLGAFMISYSKTVGIVLNTLISVGSLAVIVWTVGYRPKDALTYLRYLGATLLALLVAIGIAALVALFLNGSGYRKPFYSYPSLSYLLFGAPAFIAEVIVYSFALKSSPKDTWLAGKFSQAIILFVMTFITRASYVFAIPLIFGLASWFGARYLMRGWERAIMVSYLIVGEIIPMMISMYLVVTVADVFVPTFGRSGSETNASLFFGLIITAVFCLLVFPGIVPLFVNYDKKVLVTCLLTSFFLINTTIVFGFLGKNPYQEKTPMRITVCDVQRFWHKQDSSTAPIKSQSGYWWWPIDSDTDDFGIPEFKKVLPELEGTFEVELDYENCEDVYCSQPFIWPTTSAIKRVYWTPKDQTSPGVPDHLVNMVQMTIESDQQITPKNRKLTLAFSGPAQMNIVISPQLHWSAKISLHAVGGNIDVERAGNILWKGREMFYIYHGRGYQDEPLQIDLDLTYQLEDNPSGVIVDIQQSGLFLELTENSASPEYLDFLNRFPSWAFTGMSWSTVMRMYSLE